MKYSFVISSYDRYKDVELCIASIEKAYDYAKTVPIEIKVVFKGVKDKTVKTRYPEMVSFVTIAGIGLSAARNLGIRNSTADIIIIMDDDATVKEDFLATLDSNVKKLKARAFCGRLLDPNTKEPFAVCYKGTEIVDVDRLNFRYFRGSNIIVGRELVAKAGYFDEIFGSGVKYFAAEDSDVFFRIKKTGEKVYYLPDVVFYHVLPSAQPASKVYNYAYGTGAMLTKEIYIDPLRTFLYLYLLAEIIMKSSIRTAQVALFPKFIKDKNEVFHYSSLLKGTIEGIISYILKI